MSAPTPLTCKVCLYFESIDALGAQSGLCRRKSPRFIRAMVYGINPEGTFDWAVWPQVNENDWCGEGRTVDSPEPLVAVHHWGQQRTTDGRSAEDLFE